ncbi:methyltransferase domain-containing protein [Candidatus Bathyarchaeota archaeon]|nr:methyltransferase domain-containing protein [Candidatus Bathyarchaeota archaeon]
MRELLLNIGSFMDMYYSSNQVCIVNIDNNDLEGWALSQGYSFQRLDVRNGIPYKNNSVDLVLCSHLIEHLSRDEGDAFLKECYRVLKPKGILRLVIPDTRLLIGKYLDGSIMDYRHINVGVEKAPDTAEALFHLLIAGHQTMYDLPSLTAKLKKNGDWKIQKMTAFESQSEAIRKQTVPNFCTLSCYIEAKKGKTVLLKRYQEYLAGKIVEGNERL